LLSKDNTQLFPIVKKPGFYTGGGDGHTRIVDPNDLEAIGRTARELFQYSK